VARRELHDEYFRKAKAEGYLARSAYKLKEIQQKRRLMPRGGRVLDLGCAPGAWLQVAAEAVGRRGVVIGVDLKPVDAALPAPARAIQGDVYDLDPAALLAAAGGPFDVILSDMAPSTSGAGDHFLSVRLCDRVLELAPELLRRGGSLAMKVLEGEQYPDLLRRTGAMFESCKGLKPAASRSVSSEMYVVATGFRGLGFCTGETLAPSDVSSTGETPAPAPPRRTEPGWKAASQGGGES
jgi:23S rRNA (uridine2552-2'-O)-methyltransferase